ncbi:MAG: lamin tail domain-containing protein [Gemmatimonadota bacterium]|nr:MAG: lamin tail domain-containing protein [Gemmatimonadota bacterium]
MRGICTVGMALLFWINSGYSNIIITEVAMKANPDWVEIYNAGSWSVDVSGFRLTDLDGTDSIFASASATLLPNSYALIHWSAGTDETDDVGDLYPRNGCIDLYLNDKDLTGTDDQAVLTAGADTIDAVLWSNGDGGGRNDELNDFNILTPEFWDSQDVADWIGYERFAWSDTDEMSAKESLARYVNGADGYIDTNRKNDWYRAVNPTPGSQNDMILSVQAEQTPVPFIMALVQNYPNPFRTRTTIRYQTGNLRSPLHGTLRIYNILSQEVKLLVDGPLMNGDHSVSWNGTDNDDHDVVSGVYFFQFEIENGRWSETKKMIVLR